MPLRAVARLEITRDRKDGHQSDFDQIPQKNKRGDGERARSNQRDALQRALFSASPSEHDSQDRSLAATSQGIRDNRRQMLPPSSYSSHDNANNGGETASNPGPPISLLRRATEPPPYRTVETFRIPSSRNDARTAAQYDALGNRGDDKSQKPRTRDRLGNAVADLVQTLPLGQSSTQSNGRSDDTRSRDSGRIQDSSARKGRGEAFAGFVQSLSLGGKSARSGAANESHQTQIPRGISETVTKRHGKSRRRGYDHSTLSDSDSDSYNDDGELIRVVKTYRPTGDGAPRQNGRGAVGGPRRAVTEGARIAASVSGSSEQEDRRREPSRYYSPWLEFAIGLHGVNQRLIGSAKEDEEREW